MTRSPATIPAAWAGESAWTSLTSSPTVGLASQAIAKKIRNARAMFIATPATRMTSFLASDARTNERGSSESPSSPSSRTKPPIGSQFSV